MTRPARDTGWLLEKEILGTPFDKTSNVHQDLIYKLFSSVFMCSCSLTSHYLLLSLYRLYWVRFLLRYHQLILDTLVAI